MGGGTRPSAGRRCVGERNGVKLEPAVPGDLPAIAAIERRAFADPWSAESFAEMIGRESVWFVVARESAGDPVLGYVVAIFAADEGEVGNLAVDDAARGRGIGATLVQGVLDEATQRAVETLYLEVRESNGAARRLYDRCGFGEVGRRRRYYQKPVEDALVLRRVIGRDFP